jgi:hypothetical protein
VEVREHDMRDVVGRDAELGERVDRGSRRKRVHRPLARRPLVAAPGLDQHEPRRMLDEQRARRERDASGSILFTQVNVTTRIARELRATPSLFAYRDDFGQMQHVRDASAAFVHSLATGESQFFERDNVVYMTEVEADGALFQRNTQTQTRRRVRQLVPGSGAASPASPAPQEVTLTFSFQMDNGRWQQVCEAAACTAIMAVHRDGGQDATVRAHHIVPSGMRVACVSAALRVLLERSQLQRLVEGVGHAVGCQAG